jgi:hypothetical protein
VTADAGNPAGNPADDPAAAWVEHLRAGGTTPWRRWLRRADRSGADGSTAARATSGQGTGRLPGAAQLELLRRINELGPLPHRTDHVLSRPGPGRGPAHLRLPAAERPVAPRREVLRVATGVLADLTAQLPPPATRRRRVRRPRRASGLPAFVLEGLPLTVAEVRAGLAAAGMPEHRSRSSWTGGRRDPGPELVVVLAGPLDEALRQAWASRLQRGAARAWPRFVGEWAGRERLPASAALDDNVDYWASHVGAGNVHLVTLDAHDDPLEKVAEVLGRPLADRRAPAGPAAGDPVRLTPVALDVLRRVNVVLPFVSAPDDRAPRRTALVELLRLEDGGSDPADVPEEQRSWLTAAASRLVDAVAETGCEVHGDLDRLRTLAPASGRRVGGAEVLDAMVRMIHRADAELVAVARDGRGGR